MNRDRVKLFKLLKPFRDNIIFTESRLLNGINFSGIKKVDQILTEDNKNFKVLIRVEYHSKNKHIKIKPILASLTDGVLYNYIIDISIRGFSHSGYIGDSGYRGGIFNIILLVRCD